MVVLGDVEGSGRKELGRDRLVELLGTLQFHLRLLGRGLLRLIVIEDGGLVLLTAVCELASGIGGIDLPPEHVEQSLIRYPLWVERYLDCFTMSGGSRKYLLIRGILHVPTGVAGHDVLHSVHCLDGLLHAPEAATGERRRL